MLFLQISQDRSEKAQLFSQVLHAVVKIPESCHRVSMSSYVPSVKKIGNIWKTFRCVCSSSRAYLTPSDWRRKDETSGEQEGLRKRVQSRMALVVYSPLGSGERFTLVN